MNALANKQNCTQLSTIVCKTAQKSLSANYLAISGLILQLCNKLHTFEHTIYHVLFQDHTAQSNKKSIFQNTKPRNITKQRRFLVQNCTIVFFYIISSQIA